MKVIGSTSSTSFAARGGERRKAGARCVHLSVLNMVDESTYGSSPRTCVKDVKFVYGREHKEEKIIMSKSGKRGREPVQI